MAAASAYRADLAGVAVGVVHRQAAAALRLGHVQGQVGGLHQLRRRWSRGRCAPRRRCSPTPASGAAPSWYGSASAASVLSASSVSSPGPLECSTSRTNSSPPIRPQACRNASAHACSRWATATSSSSPTSCPRVSLTALEAVQVEIAQPDPGVRVAGGEDPVQPVAEHRAVRQAGQRVVGGLVLQPLLEPPPVGDVLHHGDGELAGRRPRRGSARPSDRSRRPRRPCGSTPCPSVRDPARRSISRCVQLPHLGRVLGVAELRDQQAAQLLGRCSPSCRRTPG